MHNLKLILIFCLVGSLNLMSCTKNETDKVTDSESYISVSFNGEPSIYFTEDFQIRNTLDNTQLSDQLYIHVEDENTVLNQKGYTTIEFGLPMGDLPESMVVKYFTSSFHLPFGNDQQSFYWMEEVDDIQVVITEIDQEEGGFVKGTLSGTVKDEITEVEGVSVTGEFRVPID